MEKQEFLTWSEMKDFCNKLPESELDKEIIWWGEERGGKINSAYQLEEDYVSTDYGFEAGSVQEYEEGQEPYPVAVTKGTPIISVD